MGQLANLITAIDAITDDVEDNVNLGDHDTWKYARPQAVTPERTPLLAVYLEPSRWDLIATVSTYELKARVVVAWYVSGSEGAETGGVGDDELVADVAELGDAMIDRLRLLSDGIPTMTGISARLIETRIAATEGVVWTMRHDLEVEQ